MLPYDVISIIGNAKNAGKTTVLNALIESFKSMRIGLTSIGMDGEALDNVTSLPKPRIKVHPSFLVATAEGCLKAAEAEYSLIEKTSIRTPLGNIVIAQAKNTGNMLVAGPSKISEMELAIEKLKQAGCPKVLIDGAFSRQSAAKLATGAVLVLGANRSPVMETVIKDAKALYERLTIAVIDERYLHLAESGLITALDGAGGKHVYDETSTLMDPERLFAWIDPSWTHVYVPRSVGTAFFRVMLKDRTKRFVLIMNDPTSLQPEEHMLAHVASFKHRLKVMRGINLIAVCLNPVSPRGYAFDEPAFHLALEQELGLPVFNVLKEA